MKPTNTSRQGQLFALCVFFLVFAACKKGGGGGGGGGGTPPPPPPISACQLVDETINNVNGYEHYWYTYTKDGKLDSIYNATTPGTGYLAYCKEDVGGFVWVTFSGTDQVHPNIFDYDYNSPTQDSSNFPTGETTSFQLGTQPNEAGFGYDFQYKSKGIFDGYNQTAPFVTGVLIGMGVEYNATGDISMMTYSVTTGPKSMSTVTTSGFDGHPSPYTGIAGWVFLTPQVSWTNTYYEPLLFALSPHNPTGSVYEVGTQKWTDAMTYIYNTQGFPTQRTIVRTGPDGTSATVETDFYSYKCH